MAFGRGAFRAPAPVRVRVSVFAVGRRVYVACAGDRRAPVTLTDDAGKTPLASLGDGTEVVILGWRPGSGGATRYRVRTTDSGLDGWLPVGNLRSTASISPATTAVPPSTIDSAAPPPEESTGRRFGQRSGAL